MYSVSQRARFIYNPNFSHDPVNISEHTVLHLSFDLYIHMYYIFATSQFI